MTFVKIRRLFGSVPVSASVPVGADARCVLRARQSIGYSVVLIPNKGKTSFLYLSKRFAEILPYK